MNRVAAVVDPVFETVRQPLLIVDADQRIVAANRPFYEAFDSVPNRTIGRSVYELGSDPENRPRLRELFDSIRSGRPVVEDFEVEQTFDSIGRRTLMINARVVPSSEDESETILLAIEDVTALRRREGQAAARELTESIVDTVRHPLLVLDHGLNVVAASRSFYRTFRVSPEETIGRAFFQLGNGQWNIDVLRRQLEAVLRGTKELDDLEVEHEFEAIGHRSMLVNARRMYHRGEDAGTILLSIEDATERIASVKSIESPNELLEVKNAEMEQFVYVVSHDLRSPLVTLSGFLGMLRSHVATGNSEKIEHCLTRLEAAVRRMSTLIEDLLNLSRVGHVRGELTRVSLTDIAEQAAESLESARKARKATLQIEAMPQVMADARRLREVFQNLLENALRYGCSEPGDTVTVGAERRSDQIVLFVRDTGPGIALEHHERIFRLFERLDYESEGTGVGLALVSRIAQAHNGKAWVESKPGDGATFYVSLPAALHAESSAS